MAKNKLLCQDKVESGTLEALVGTLSEATCKKTGKICFVSGRLSGSFSGTGNLVKIPEGFRPSSRRTLLLNMNYNNTWVSWFGAIGTSGILDVSYGSGTVTNLYFNGSYII